MHTECLRVVLRERERPSVGCEGFGIRDSRWKSDKSENKKKEELKQK